MENLVQEEMKRKVTLSEFEQKVAEGKIDWSVFDGLDERDKQIAFVYLGQKKIISTEAKGNFAVILADSCNPSAALPRLDNQQVYFTRREDAQGYSDHLHIRGCLNIHKQKD